MNFNQECENVLRQIKQSTWFPYKSGILKFKATKGTPINSSTYEIKFDSTVASYVQFLEEGTKPHDIPFAFVGKGNWVYWYPYGDNVPFLMGMGGRFDGKFHPGSTKHKGFISEKCIDEICEYFALKYHGKVEKL